MRVNRLNAFSDTAAYPGQSRDLTVGCYLIRHGDQLMLWDLGLPTALKDAAFSTDGDMSATVRKSLVEQLAELDIKPDDVDVVGVSHFHFDHIGQLPDFPAAKLYIGKRDWDLLTQSEPPAFLDPKPFARWI
ncbi:MBL fold metallo-hydrolase, partial [Streptomyces sp. CO7]